MKPSHQSRSCRGRVSWIGWILVEDLAPLVKILRWLAACLERHSASLSKQKMHFSSYDFNAKSSDKYLRPVDQPNSLLSANLFSVRFFTFFDNFLCLFILGAGHGMLNLRKAIKNWNCSLLPFDLKFAPLNLLNHGSHRRITLLNQILLNIWKKKNKKKK